MELELILMRQLASCLSIPVFLVDPSGDLVFYNEHAEKILGRRFDESGPMPVRELAALFRPCDEDENPMEFSQLPLAMALSQRKPVHKRLRIRGLDGRRRQIEVVAFPIIGQHKQLAGAAALFWEIKEPRT